MFTDFVLASLHHILAFGLAGLLVAESVLLRPGLRRETIARLLTIDTLYGTVALSLIAIGLGRVFFGLKGSEYYLANHWFWGKMAVFILIGLLSIKPTMTFFGWRRALRDDPEFLPDAATIGRTRQFVMAESHLLVFVLVFAAAMARYAT